MKNLLLFVGNKFINNDPLRRYTLRHVEASLGKIDQIQMVADSDNTLFLELEALLSQELRIVIATSKSSSAVVGKLLSTITLDNQILKEQMLIPSQASLFETGSYLLEYSKAYVNVIIATENETLPQILMEPEQRSATVHLFNEELSSAKMLLEPLSQSFDTRLDFTTIVPGWIEVTVHSRRYGNIAQFITSAKQLLPNKVIASSNLVAYIIERLSHNNKKLTFAESCTGGLLAYYFTQNSGASAVFEGSLVTYSNTLKANWLAVDDDILEEYGAVSGEVVAEMSEGALNVSYADYALAISGIAGPDGGSDEKPVGTVCIAARSKTELHHEQLHFQGDRNYIQEQSALYAIKMLLMIDRTLFF